VVSLKKSVFLGCVLALLMTACASPAGSGLDLSGPIDSPTTPWADAGFRSDGAADFFVTTEPSEQLVEWAGPFTIWLEMGLPIRLTQPSSLNWALGTVPGRAPEGRPWEAQLPSETPSTTQPTPSAAELASDRGDQEGLEDVSATTVSHELPHSDPPPAAVDGSTATDDQAGGGGSQTVESDRCQDWQPRPGDELRPCMGGPQFVP